MFTVVATDSLFLDETANLDIVAGGRVWPVDTKLKLEGGNLDGWSASDDETWVDPVTGLKGRANFTPEFTLRAGDSSAALASFRKSCGTSWAASASRPVTVSTLLPDIVESVPTAATTVASTM